MLVVWQLVMLTYIFKFHKSAHLLCQLSHNPSSPAGSVIAQINLNPTQLPDHQHHPVRKRRHISQCGEDIGEDESISA